MPLPDAATNIVISIWRASEDEFAGQREPRLVHADVRAFFEEKTEFERGEGGVAAPKRERIVQGTFLFDAYTDDGATIDIKSGDEIKFEDYRGAESTREVVLVTPNYVFGHLDTIIAEVK